MGQDYTSYFTGDTADVTTNHEFGICLMGGATESDEAMIWFLNKADGGDVLVLRASGSDGYNDYFYSELGVTINSVETLVIHNAAGAIDPYVLQQVANAEAIWFAGGDQYDYVSYFKDNELEDLLNDHINVRSAVIGGTSAGMAILGRHYFDAENGTVTSAQALADPYDSRVSIGSNDFLDIPFLSNLITDTHYDDPDRRGRHMVFMARIAVDGQERPFGIACEEYTAVCVDANGMASVYGGYPSFDDFAYFLQVNCGNSGYEPEICTPGTPLTWVQNDDAIRAYKVPGTTQGELAMDLNTWEALSANGVWEHWTADNGNFQSTAGIDPECNTLGVPDVNGIDIAVYPNPFSNTIYLNGNLDNLVLQLHDVHGRQIPMDVDRFQKKIHTAQLSDGLYFLTITSDLGDRVIKLVRMIE